MAEYDDGFDSADSFEAAGADRPEDLIDPEEAFEEDWEAAKLYFLLDPSFQYSREQKKDYIKAFRLDRQRPIEFPPHSVYFTLDEWNATARLMIQMGGAFAACIGEAMFKADNGNRDRIAYAFSELLERYRPAKGE